MSAPPLPEDVAALRVRADKWLSVFKQGGLRDLIQDLIATLEDCHDALIAREHEIDRLHDEAP